MKSNICIYLTLNWVAIIVDVAVRLEVIYEFSGGK